MNYDIIVIGAGASGMTAAITAKRCAPSLSVAILEGKDRVGKKLLTTGNGRCNITNSDDSLIHYHSSTGDVKKYLDKFSLYDTMSFFESMGVEIVDDGGDKLFPASFQAATVLDVLRFECERLNVDVITNEKVNYVTDECGVFTNNHSYKAKALIVACGGKAAPNTGSDGSGIEILKSLGHRISPLFPSIVPVKTDLTDIKSLKGIKVDCRLTIEDDNSAHESTGELLFTEYGVSGPSVLLLSRYATTMKSPVLSIDLAMNYDKQALYDKLIKRRENSYADICGNLMLGMFNRRVYEAVLRKCGIGLNDKASGLSDGRIEQLAATLKAFKLNVRGVCGFEAAQTTAGGAYLSEFDDNLRSLKVKNLYACGEVLDVDGDCGGYNLQWAWTSGHIAGESAANAVKLK